MQELFGSMPPAVWVAIAGGFGLLVGSFLNVVIHRLPKMLETGWLSDARDILDQLGEDGGPHSAAYQQASKVVGATLTPQRYNLVVPRSACPHCGHAISALENIPLLSYALQGGKCKGCQARISPRYPLVELLSGLAAASCMAQFGGQDLWLALALYMLCATLLALTFIDLDTMYLPDDLTLPLVWAGVLLAWAGHGLVGLPQAVLGAAAGYLLLWSVYWLFKLTTGKEGMGYGDFKLLAALGAWLGWQALPQIIVIASAVGAVVGILMIALGKHAWQKKLPFGPYLAMGGVITLFAGNLILH